MSSDQPTPNIVGFGDDDIQLDGNTALLLEKLIDLKGECFINIFIGKLSSLLVNSPKH